MKTTAIIVTVYGFLLLIGGWMGHCKAASNASLIAGGISGILMLLCAWGMFAKKRFAYYAALFLTFALDGFFTYRFAKTLSFFPSGLMSLISLIILILIALRAPKKKSSR